jgi:hypothetical protein
MLSRPTFEIGASEIELFSVLASFAHEHEIANVDKKAHSLTCDNHRVSSENRIGENRCTPQEAEPPKCDGNDRLAFPLRGQPLHQKPCGEEGLTQKAYRQPEGHI